MKKYKVLFKRQGSIWNVEEFKASEKIEMINLINELNDLGYSIELYVKKQLTKIDDFLKEEKINV